MSGLVEDCLPHVLVWLIAMAASSAAVLAPNNAGPAPAGQAVAWRAMAEADAELQAPDWLDSRRWPVNPAWPYERR